MTGNSLSLHEARVRRFDPETGVATVVMPGPYGMEPIEAAPFVRNQINPAMIPSLVVGDRVLVTMNENEPPEWTAAHVENSALAAWPVGSVFISIVATNPSVLLGGGTWVSFATGRMLVGQTGTDVDFDTPEEVGGAKTVVLTEANLASHDHTMAHTHTFADTSGGPSVASTGTESANHTHTWSDTAATVSTHAGHTHNIDVRENPVSGSAGYIGLSNAGGTLQTRASDTAGSHTHTVSVSGTTAADTTSHTHSLSSHTHAISGTTSASSAANTGLAGSATAVNKMPPYVVVYMWKRTL